jgi:hypothetical protein
MHLIGKLGLDETAHGQALDEQLPEETGQPVNAGRPRGVIVMGNDAAHG